MSSTDYLRLGECKIFKETTENLPKNLMRTLNVLALKDSVLFTWDFGNNCVLSLNVKAVRGKDGDNVIHQKLLPLHPPLFTPELLIANESGTLLAVAGPNGILVLQLPARCPPHGAFDNNKEVVYCRSCSLDERLLACSDTIEVRQVKFHPGSINDSHVLVLTSDNTLRLYHIEKNEAVNLATYPIGEKPGGVFPGTKTLFLDLYGEIAVDFDFGVPEIADKQVLKEFDELMIVEKDKRNSLKKIEALKSQSEKKITPKSTKEHNESAKETTKEMIWPVYILRGDFSVYSLNIELNRRSKVALKGPYPIVGQPDDIEGEACSIISLKTTPQIICIATSTGTLTHSILLNMNPDIYNELKETAQYLGEVPDKELLVFETVELELGLNIQEVEEGSKKYKCPIFLHKDASKLSRYFATHSAGVHDINISCVEDLQNFVFGEDADATADIFAQPSSAEYMICTKTASSEKFNPVVGFTLYYEPTSIITLLADGSLVTLGILVAPLVVKKDTLQDREELTSPLKKMLSEPFDQYIQKVLRKAASQPVLKLSNTISNSPEESYELLQRASQVFREEHFKYHNKVREDLEKRIHTLRMLKDTQLKEMENMNNGKEAIRQKAEDLAEKYEDIKDKQDDLVKRCEQLLMLVSRKKSEPSNAEKKFMTDLDGFGEKCNAYQASIDKLKNKLKYQQMQIQNWKDQEKKKVVALSEMQSHTIKNSLQESSQKINGMMKEVKDYKRILGVK